jgi:sugar phosphate isomerase/epimerase
MQLLCSTGTFSRYPNFTDYRALLTYGPQLDVEGFELMFYPAWYSHIARIADDLSRSHLNIPVMHSEKNIGNVLGNPEPAIRAQGVRWLEDNCRLGQLLGTRLLVLHLWGWPEMDDHLEYNLQPLPACLEIATRYGLELALETIPCRQADPLQNVHRALEQDSRCRVVLDTEFLAQHQQLQDVFQANWLWQSEYVRHVHIKDFDGQAFHPDGNRKYLHPGEGHIDFTRFFTDLKHCDFHGSVSLEASVIDTEGNVNLAKLQKSLSTIRQLLA